MGVGFRDEQGTAYWYEKGVGDIRGDIRSFDTGATRGSDVSKPDYEGFISPLVVYRFGQYMHKHRQQADGALRPSDNWQKGIPNDSYVKSGDRHWLDVKLWQRGYGLLGHEHEVDYDIEDALCAVIFNASGLLHNILHAKHQAPSPHTD